MTVLQEVPEEVPAEQAGPLANCTNCGVRRWRTAFFDAGWALLCPARDFLACEWRRNTVPEQEA